MEAVACRVGDDDGPVAKTVANQSVEAEPSVGLSSDLDIPIIHL